jgi:hypothetical protein
MALVRILVDGYSLLHGWPGLAAGEPRHSAAAREALIARLQQYRDACGTPITVVFDGAEASTDTIRMQNRSSEMEVLYSRPGQTADEVIERAAHRLSAFGEVLVVTDDRTEREVAAGLGALTASCENFIRTLEATDEELRADLERINRQERGRFHQRD